MSPAAVGFERERERLTRDDVLRPQQLLRAMLAES